MAETKQTKTTVELTAKSHSQHHAKKPNVTVLVDPGDVAEFSHGFVNFLREHAVVGLAVGFVIGTQVQGVVKQLVASFIDPLFTLLFGQALSKESVAVHFHGRHAAVGWGAFVYTLLDFLFVLLVIYAVIKLFKLDKLDKPSKS